MSFSTTAANEITQTGTDTDYSGLVGLAGITTTDRIYYTEYDLGPNRLILEGTSTLAGTVREQLSFDDTATFNRIEISSGAVFTVGTLEANPLDYDYMLNVPSISEEIGTLGFSEKNGFNAIGFDASTRSTIYINGGTFNSYGRIINIGAYGSTAASILDFRYSKFSRPGASFSYNSNYTLLNTAVTTAFVASSYSSFEGFQPVIGSTFYVGLSNTTPNNAVYDLKDIPDLNGTRIVETGKGGVNDSNSPLIRYTNLALGSDQIFHVSAGRYWRTELYSEVKIRALDTVRNALPNARAWYAGAVGVNEVNNVDGSGDYDFTFLFATRKASSGTIDPYVFYTKNGDTTDDLINVGCIELTKNISKLPDISLRGLGVKTVDVLLSDDILMTELVEATISAYTEINDAFRGYDTLKLLLVNNYIDEDETIVGRSGSQLVSRNNRDLVLDSAAVSVSDYTATETTLKTSTFTGGFDDDGGTGIAIVQSATALNSGVFDSDVSYDSSALTLTDITCSKEIVFQNAGTYSIVGSTLTDVDAPVAVTLNIDVNTTISGTIGANVTVNTPTGQIDFTGLVAGSQIVVCQTGTQTEVFRENSSGTTETTGAIASGTYDYTVMKVDQFPIRVTGVVVGTSPVAAQISQQEDRAYVASSGLTFGTTATINTGTKRVAVTVATTPQNSYSFWKEAWIAESSLVNTQFDFSPFGSSSFSLNNGYEFTAGSLQYLGRDGFRYVDSGGTVTARYLAVLTQNVTAGLQVEYQQVLGAAPVDAQNTGNADQVIQIFGDATHGNFDYTGHLVLKVQANGYREARLDLVATYGTLEETFYVAPLPTIAIDGLTLGDPAPTGLTITKEATPVSYDAGDGAKDYSITILDTNTNSAETIQRWINYNLAQDATFQGFEPFNLPELVLGDETIRGIVENDGTPVQHGVFVTRDGTNPHPDYTRFQADNGTYGVVPIVANVSGTGMPTTGTARLQIINNTAAGVSAWQATTAYSAGDKVLRTTGAGLENTAGLYFVATTAGTTGGTEPTWDTVVDNTTADGSVVWTCYAILFYDADPGAATYATTYTDGEEFSAGDSITIRFAILNGATSFSRFETTIIAQTTGFSFAVSVVDDEVYALNAEDGLSTPITDIFTADYQAGRIIADSDADLDWTFPRMYAFYCGELTNSTGMYRLWGGVTAIDAGTYRNNTAIASIFIASTNGFTKQADGDTSRFFRDDGANPFLEPPEVAFGTAGNWKVPVYLQNLPGASVLSAGESAQLAATAKEATLTEIKGAGWSTETLKDIRDNVGAGGGLDEAGLHAGLDSYANKGDYKAAALSLPVDSNVTQVNGVAVTDIEDFKADVNGVAAASELATVKSNQAIMNDNIKKGSTYPVISGPDTET